MWHAVDGDHPFMPFTLLILLESGGGGSRAEQQVMTFKEVTPDSGEPMALVVVLEPVTVKHRLRPYSLGGVATLLWVQCSRQADVIRCFLVAHPTRGRRAQQLNVVAMRVAHVECRPRRLIDLHSPAAQKPNQFAQHCLNFFVDFRFRIRIHDSYPVIAQSDVVRARQAKLPTHRLFGGWTRHRVEGDGKIVSAPRHRPHHRDVGVRIPAGQRLTAWRDNPVGGLVTVDATVVGRVTDRRADIAARIEAGQPLWKRLAYVAITRASERLYWVVRNRLAKPTYDLRVDDLAVAPVPLTLEAQEDAP